MDALPRVRRQRKDQKLELRLRCRRAEENSGAGTIFFAPAPSVHAERIELRLSPQIASCADFKLMNAQEAIGILPDSSIGFLDVRLSLNRLGDFIRLAPDQCLRIEPETSAAASNSI